VTTVRYIVPYGVKESRYGRRVKGGDVAGSDDGKMATIKGSDLCEAEPFGDCHDRRVHAAKRKILVLRDERAHPLVVLACRLDHGQCAHGERMQELGFHLAARLALQEMTDFGNDGRRHQQRRRGLSKQPSTALVVRVGACSRSHDRAGVKQDHERPNSARRISSERSPRSGSSLSKLPTHGGGHGSPVEPTSWAAMTCRRWPGRTPWRRSSAISCSASAGTTTSHSSAAPVLDMPPV
jgi:hypothetical protein